MCILFIAINQHPKHPLIIAANRDEFHQRPTKQLHAWQDKKIYAGKDLQAGGTWLGVNELGEFAALTNIRDLSQHNDNAKSRGELVTLALQPNSVIDIEWLKNESANYNPFNLIYSKNNTLYCFNSMDRTQQTLTAGFHAICNGAIDDIWPKMARGEQQLEQLISNNLHIKTSDLFAILQDTQQAPAHLLPNTGIGLKWETFLSSIFIQSNEYGTRSSCALLFNNDNSFNLVEQSYKIDGSVFNTQQFKIKIKETP